MTSRRNFLGLLVAAPVVGPEIMKAAVAAQPYHRAAFARGTTFLAPVSRLETARAAYTAQLHLAHLGNGEALSGISGFASEYLAAAREVYDDRPPNRLHGSYVNADGDAT